MISASSNAPDLGLPQHVFHVSQAPQHSSSSSTASSSPALQTAPAPHSNKINKTSKSANNTPPLSVIQSELILSSIPPTSALLSSSKFKSGGSAAATPKKKLVVACIGCRKKKIKCSSDRPACSNCLRLNIPCEYPVIRNRGSRFGYMEMLNRRMQHLEKYINCSTNPNYKPQFVTIHQKPERPTQLLYTSCGSTRGTVNSGYTNIKSNANLLSDLVKPSSTETDSLITQLGPTIHQEVTPPPSDDFLSASPAVTRMDASVSSWGASVTPGYLSNSGQLPPMEIVIHLTELYFRNIHGQTYNFLHKPTFMPRIKEGRVNKTLLLALCGLTSRYSTHPAIATSTPYQAGEGFIAAARKSLSEQFDDPTLETVQALIFIVQNDFFKSKSKKAMIYVSLAIRMATTLELHLNSKDPNMSFIEHEERRRTYWSLLTLDRLAHSAPHWQLQLRTDTLEIQLPCKDYYYENNIPVITETLSGEYSNMAKATGTNEATGNNNYSSKYTNSVPAVKSEKGMYAYIVIVTILWCDINKYVMEGYKNETLPPWKEGSTYHKLETRLQQLIESIPKEYEYSKENLISLDPTNQATALIHLHAQLRISLCSLSRSVYPFNYKVMKFDEEPPKAFLESAARSIMASANSLSSVIGDALTIEDIHVAPFIGFGVFTVSSVHIANSFSSDPAIVQAAKDHLATCLKFLVMMREYFYSVGVWCIILKDRYFQKARRHKTKANTKRSHFAGKGDESNDIQKAENDEEDSGAATSAIRARELKPESVVSGADGFSRPGTPPVAYAPEELMNIAANKNHNSHPSSGISTPKLDSTGHDEENLAREISRFTASTNQANVEKTETKPGDDGDETNDERDLEKSHARTWKRALPKMFDEPLSEQSLSQQQQQQRSATKQILLLFPTAKRAKMANKDDDGLLRKETSYTDGSMAVSPSHFTDILTRSAFSEPRGTSSTTKGSSDTSKKGTTTGTSHLSSDDGDFISIPAPGSLSTDGADNTATTATSTTNNRSSSNMKNVLLENSGEWLNSLELLGMAHFADPKVPVPNMSNLTHWFGGKLEGTDPSAESSGAAGARKSSANDTPKPKVAQPPMPELDFGDEEHDNTNNKEDGSSDSSKTATDTTTGMDDNEDGLKSTSLLDEIFGQVSQVILSSETSESPSSLSPSSLIGN